MRQYLDLNLFRIPWYAFSKFSKKQQVHITGFYEPDQDDMVSDSEDSEEVAADMAERARIEKKSNLVPTMEDIETSDEEEEEETSDEDMEVLDPKL